MEDRSLRAAVLGACASEVAAADAPDLAAWLLRRAVELAPTEGGLRSARVACLLDTGQPGEALQELDDAGRASALVPNEALLRAAAFQALGKGAEGLEWAQRAVALRPSDARGHAAPGGPVLERGTRDGAP